jgi:hypothetical protein
LGRLARNPADVADPPRAPFDSLAMNHMLHWFDDFGLHSMLGHHHNETVDLVGFVAVFAGRLRSMDS